MFAQASQKQYVLGNLKNSSRNLHHYLSELIFPFIKEPILLILVNLFPKEDQQDQLQHHLIFYSHHLGAYLLEQFSRELGQEM